MRGISPVAVLAALLVATVAGASALVFFFPVANNSTNADSCGWFDQRLECKGQVLVNGTITKEGSVWYRKGTDLQNLWITFTYKNVTETRHAYGILYPTTDYQVGGPACILLGIENRWWHGWQVGECNPEDPPFQGQTG